MGENLLKDRILGQKDIEELIPHRGKWLLLNKIVEIQEKSIVAIKIYTVEECQGHFPEDLVVPGILICESFAQAGLSLVSYHQRALGREKLPALGHIIDAKFFSPVRPGERVTLEVELVNSREAACLFRGMASVSLKRVARWEGTGVFRDKPK